VGVDAGILPVPGAFLCGRHLPQLCGCGVQLVRRWVHRCRDSDRDRERDRDRDREGVRGCMCMAAWATSAQSAADEAASWDGWLRVLPEREEIPHNALPIIQTFTS
jgi:hypothetical protein